MSLQKNLKEFFKGIGGQETMDKAMMLMNADDRSTPCVARLVRLRQFENGQEPTLSREWISENETATRAVWRTPAKHTIKPLLHYLHAHIDPDHFMTLFKAEPNDLDVVLFVRDWVRYTKTAYYDNEHAQEYLSTLVDVFDSTAQALENGGHVTVQSIGEHGVGVHAHGKDCGCDENKTGAVDELLNLLKKFVSKKKPH